MPSALPGFPPGSVIAITGIMGAGKSTVAAALAQQLDKSVHVRGDTFRRAIVRGRIEMTPDASEEALGQLRLRYELGAAVCDRFAGAGFAVVYQDILFGQDWAAVPERIASRPLFGVVLAVAPNVALARAAAREKVSGYGDWTAEDLDALLRATPRMGLWLDSSAQEPDETVDEIILRAEQAQIG